MKCGYGKHCKFDGDVEKSIAIKSNSRYWHKECLYERDMKNRIIKEYYEIYENKEPIVAARKALNKYINEDKYDVGYIYYCLKYRSKKLNSLFGLSYQLADNKNIQDYNRIKARNKKLRDFIENKEEYYRDRRSVKIDKKKGWGDFFE